MIRKDHSLLAALLLLAAGLAQAQRNEEPPLVLTALGPVHQITAALLQDTGISVENIPQQPRSLAAQPAFMTRQAEQFAARFQAAQAVVSINRIWPQDNFYTAARQFDIRTVPIDASQPWSFIHGGVAVARSPVSGEASPWFWTSPSNVIQMLGILARDLQALYPGQAEAIAGNLARQRDYYLNLKADYETRFLDVPDPTVYALADEFVYLTRDLGLFVEGYFVKQDIDWTGPDLRALTDHLRESDVRVVIHKWEPSMEIQAAIAAAGAELVVLDLMETATEGFRSGMESNLENLLAALLRAGGP